MLSLQVFTRQNVDVALARKEMEQVAETLRRHFTENPDELDRVISEDAFLKLNDYPNVIVFFPENVKTALTTFNLFSVFNLMRSIDQLNVDSALLAAYMISEQDWNSIRQKVDVVQRIGASIVDVDTAAAIFVNDSPLCSQTVSDMIASIKRDIESLKRTHIAKLNSLDQIVQQEIQSTEKNIQDNVDRAIQTTKSWSNIISKFSYVDYVLKSINLSPDEKKIMWFISRFGNAVYASYLSREVPILTDTLRAVSIGKYKHEYPEDLLKSADKYELSSVLGNTSFEMHTLMGRRWLMYSLDKFQLQEESQQLDADVLMIRQKIQDMLVALNSQNLNQIMEMFDETLPQFLLSSTIGNSSADEDVKKFKNDLKTIIFEYFKITNAIQEFVDETESAIETNGLSVVDHDMFSRLSDLIDGFQQYKTLVNEFHNSQTSTAVTAYRRLIEDDSVRFDNIAYGLLSELNNSANINLVQSPFRFERIVSYSKFNPRVKLSEILSVKFKKEDLNLRQTDQSFYIKGLNYYPLVYVYGYCRAFLFFASKYPNAFAEFIDETFNVNLRNISTTSFILNAIFPNDNIFRYGFSALNKFISATDDYVDGIKNYFACMYIYRNFKSVNFEDIPLTNSFYEVLDRYRSENSIRPSIGEFFSNINPPSSWSDEEFLEIVGKTVKAPKVVVKTIYFEKDSIEIDKLRPVVEHKTIAKEVEKETNFRPLFYNQSIKAEDFVKRTFLALDALLGGTISPEGEVILRDACIYVNQAKERFFSILFACVFVYIRNVEDDPQYPGASILTTWMLLESHFNSANSSQSKLSDVILSTLDNEDTPSRGQQSSFDFETVWDISTRFIRIIQFHKFKPRTIQSVLIGTDGIFNEPKTFLWTKCSEEHKRIISSWINVRFAYYHTQLNSDDVNAWIDAKRIMFLLNDHTIISTIYAFYILDIQTETAAAILNDYRQNLSWPRATQQQLYIDYAIRDVNSVDGIQRLEFTSKVDAQDSISRELAKVQAYAGIKQTSIIFELFQMLAFDEILHKMSRRVVKEKNDALSTLVVNFSQNEKESRNIMEYFNDENSSRSSFYPILLNLSNTAEVTISDFLNVLLSVVLLIEDDENDFSTFQNPAIFVSVESSKSISANALAANKNQITTELLVTAVIQLATQLKVNGQDVIEEFKQNVDQTCALISDVIYTEYVNEDMIIDRSYSFALVEVYMNMLSTLDYTEKNKKKYEDLFDTLRAAYIQLVDADTKTIEQLEFLLAANQEESYTIELSTLSVELQKMFDPTVFKTLYDTSWLVESKKTIRYVIDILLYLNTERQRVETNLKLTFKRLCDKRVSPSFVFSRLDTDYSSLMITYFNLFNGLDPQRSERLLPTPVDLKQEESAVLYFAYETQTPLNTCIWSYHSPFFPPYVSAILTLREIENACAVTVYAGLFAFSLNQINQGVQQDIKELISNNLQDDAFINSGTVATLRNRLINFSASVLAVDRYTPIQVIWAMTLKELIKDLKEQSLSSIRYINDEWRKFVVNEYNQSQMPLKEKLEQITVRFIATLLKEKWRSMLETKLTGDTTYTVFVEDNILLTQYGIHGELAALIKAQNK